MKRRLTTLRIYPRSLAMTAPLMLVSLVLAAGLLIGLMPTAHAASGTVSEDLQMASDSATFRLAAEAFIARAMAGDATATQAMLSRQLVERSGEAAIRSALQQQILPFFQRGREPGRSVTITRTTDASGQQGFAFYMWMQFADSAARPFTVYTVKEQGRIVVANVVPDRLVEGRHR
jgi:hypothetical protein